MKALFSILLLFAVVNQAVARAVFEDYDGLSLETKAAWDYTVSRSSGSNPGLYVRIPPKRVKLYKAAKLFVYDAQDQLVLEMVMGLQPTSGGGLEININLRKESKARAELVIASDLDPSIAMFPEFGGFTFKLSNIR